MDIRALFAFYLMNSKAHFVDRNINEEIANSLLYVIENFFVPRSPSFIIVVSFEREKSKHFYQDLSGTLFGSYDNIKTDIVVNKGMTIGSGLAKARMRNFNMLVVDSLNSFLNIDLANKVKNFDINEFYYIFLHTKDRFLEAEIAGILEYCWSHYIINVNVEVQTARGDIIVYTYFPFGESYCRKVIPVEVNRFKNGTMINADLFPEKLQNMHGCPLKVATWHTSPYITLHHTKRAGKIVQSGFEGLLLKELSFLMNFTIKIVSPPKSEGRGLIFFNYTTGATSMLMNRTADLSLGSFWFTKPRSQILTASGSYFQSSNVAVLIRNSLNYQSPNVLWFPYKYAASVALITSFLIMAGLARILEKLSTDVPGKKPRNQCINFIAWTLGLPSLTMPVKNSQRLFVMAWILFGLVIRAQYAGIIFHLLRNNLFKKIPSTISDVVNLEYTILVTKTGYEGLAQTSVFTDTGLRYKILESKGAESPLLVYLEQHPNEKVFAILPLESLLGYLGENRKAGVLTVLKESLLLQNLCIYFTKHSFLVDRMNMLIQRIVSAGLFDSWVKQTIDWSYLNSPIPPQEIVIGQWELEGVYYVWLGLTGFGFLVFCAEKLSKKFKILKTVLDKLAL